MVLRPLVLGGRPRPDGRLLLHDRAEGIAAALRAGPRLLRRRPGVPADDGRRHRRARLPPAAASRFSTTATSSIRRCSRPSSTPRSRSTSRPTSTGHGQIGKRFAQALADRARAGVTVKILLDAVGSTSIGEDILQIARSRRLPGGLVQPDSLVHARPLQPPHAPQVAHHRRRPGLHRRRGHRRSVGGPRAGSRALARHPDSRRRAGGDAAADRVRGQLAAHDRRADLGPAVLPAARSQRARWSRRRSSAHRRSAPRRSA